MAAALLVGALVSFSSDSSDGQAAPLEPASTTTTALLTECDPVVDETASASAAEIHDLVGQLNSFGRRMPGSDAHDQVIDWLVEDFSALPDMSIVVQEFPIERWLPTTERKDGPGLDLAAAGALSIDGAEVPVAGPVPFSDPTTDTGVSAPLVFVPSSEEITAANVEGKIVVHDVLPASVPYAVFPGLAHYLSPDVPSSGDLARPHLRRELASTLDAADGAGAVGAVFLRDVPTDQLLGYWQPHTGTRYGVSAVTVGSDQADVVRDAAKRGEPANVTIRAEWDEHVGRNIVATLRGESRERIVVSTHTDGVTWIQENGSIGALAMARYLARLPEGCRHRDVQFALTANHLSMANEGTASYADQLDEDYDDGTVAFVMAMEHLGARKVLPDTDGTLVAGDEPELFTWIAPQESETLVKASVNAVKRRQVGETAVLRGVDSPRDTVPPYCSQGGLGARSTSDSFRPMGAISGPWTLWTNVPGDQAFDGSQMRDQVLVLTDVARELDETPRKAIAGDSVSMRDRRAAGAATC